MLLIIFWIIFVYVFTTTSGLLCYNCSSTHRDWTECGGDFVSAHVLYFNSSRGYLVNCTGENAMCFVRSWSARAHHSWMVQRGCYQSFKGDSLPPSMYLPNRAMTCKYEKYADGDYKICLCQADWCNSESKIQAVYFLIICSICLSTQHLHIFLKQPFK